MPQNSVEIVREIYARWAQGDFSASVEHFDESIVLVVDPHIPDSGTYVARDGVRQYMLRFLEPWESLTMTGESFREAGDRVLVAVRQSGVGRSSEVPVELRYFHLWTFRGRRVVRLEAILSEQGAVDALRSK
jgi:ketosteroid isomerase-like protein